MRQSILLDGLPDGLPKGGRALGRPINIMKRKWLAVVLVAVGLAFLAGVALAETDPIVCDIEINPAKLSGPGKVSVTINISNSGSTDMKDPLILYNPVSQAVSDFGDNGSVMLKAGESKTWTGEWDVNQRTLENGYVVFFVKYTLYKDTGESYSQSQPIRGKISMQTAEAEIDVKRTITPMMAREDQEVIVKYDISNTGTVSLKDVTIQENKDINKESQKIPELKPGDTAQVKFPVKMGKKDLTSSATVTYQAVGASKVGSTTVEPAVITYGEPDMTAKLTASAKGVALNDKVTLKLALSNKGNVDYSNLRVSDSTLGEVFSNQTLAKDGKLELEKEVTLTATTEYQFTITAIDNTGTEVTVVTDAVSVGVVDPDKAVHLSVVTTADRNEVYEQPGRVRFTITVTNDSEEEAKDVVISHGAMKIYTFASIPPGETRKLTRDAALSMEGKYQFTASTINAFEEAVSFPSNEVQIAFSVPTPAPATPTPVPDPTAEPTFSPVTMPPITDPSIAAFPKIVQQVLLPVLILGTLMLISSGVLLAIAAKRRADQKKASEAAYDHLERSKRRDYVTPAEPEEELPVRTVRKEDSFEGEEVLAQAKSGGAPGKKRRKDEIPLDDVELPHMKYVRNAFERSSDSGVQTQYSSDDDLYDGEYYGGDGEFMDSGHKGVMYEEAYEDDYDQPSYGDSYTQEPRYDAGDGYQDGYGDPAGDAYGDSYDDAYEAPRGSSDEYQDPGYEEAPYDEKSADPYGRGQDDENFADSDYPGEDKPSRRTGRTRASSQESQIGY